MHFDKRIRIICGLGLICIMLYLSPSIMASFQTQQTGNLGNSSQNNNVNTPNVIVLPKGVTIYSPDANGFIINWLLAGIFPEGSTTWGNYYTQASASASQVDPTQLYSINSQTIPTSPACLGSTPVKTFNAYQSPNDYIDLNQALNGGVESDYCAGYAVAYIYFPQTYSNVYIFAGSDDGCKIFWDQIPSPVDYYNQPRGLTEDQDKISIGAVNYGWNPVMFCTIQQQGGWEFSFRLSTNPTAFVAIPGLQISLTPQTTGAIPWWNNSNGTANFRIPVTLSATNQLNDGSIISQSINFTDQLQNLRFNGSVNTGSVRVVEYSPQYTSNWMVAPSNTSLSTIVNGVGNVSWVATNTTYAGIPRYYYVYFNTTSPVTPLYGVNNYGQTFNNATTNFSITQSFADYYNHTVCNQTVPYASWWNNNWLFRAGINVTASGTITYDDELIQYANFDFAQLIGEVYGGSLTFDPNSIRLIEIR